MVEPKGAGGPSSDDPFADVLGELQQKADKTDRSAQEWNSPAPEDLSLVTLFDNFAARLAAVATQDIVLRLSRRTERVVERRGVLGRRISYDRPTVTPEKVVQGWWAFEARSFTLQDETNRHGKVLGSHGLAITAEARPLLVWRTKAGQDERQMSCEPVDHMVFTQSGANVSFNSKQLGVPFGPTMLDAIWNGLALYGPDPFHDRDPNLDLAVWRYARLRKRLAIRLRDLGQG